MAVDQGPVSLQQIINGLQQTVKAIANLAQFLRFSINNIRAGTLLGNPTNAAGPLKRISLGSNLEFSGTQLNVNSAFSARVAALEAAEIWQNYVPSITASSGTFGTVVLNFAAYKRSSNSIFCRLDFTISSVGSGANHIIATLPVNSINGNWAAFGSEFDVAGFSLAARNYSNNPGNLHIFKYDNTDPITANGRYALSIEYQIAP